jgi:hypothetical protein
VAEAVVEVAMAAITIATNTTNTNIHPPALPLPTGNTPRVKQQKDLHTAGEAATHTDTMVHEALDITAEDEEDGEASVAAEALEVAEDTEDRLHLVG